MTIAIDVRAVLEPIGGVSEYVRSLISHLTVLPSRHRIILFSNAHNRKPAFSLPRDSQASFVSLTLPNKALNASILLTGRPYIDELIRKVTGIQCDIVFMPNINFGWGSPRVKTVLTVHDLSFATYRHLLPVKDRVWHRAVRISSRMKSADAIVAVSAATKRDLVRFYGIPEDKISVTHLGCGEEFSSDATAPARNTLRLPSRYVYCLGGGGRKNNETLLFAYALLARRMTNPPVLLIAGLDERAQRRFSHLARRLGIEGVVHLAGYVPFSYRRSYYAHAECFAYVSLSEGFGLPPLEAAKCGTPVVASAAGSIGEVMGNAALLVNPYSAQDIADALFTMLSDESVRMTYRERATRRAGMFSWETCAKQTLRILERV